jgi:hypothetical protein
MEVIMYKKPFASSVFIDIYCDILLSGCEKRLLDVIM